MYTVESHLFGVPVVVAKFASLYQAEWFAQRFLEFAHVEGMRVIRNGVTLACYGEPFLDSTVCHHTASAIAKREAKSDAHWAQYVAQWEARKVAESLLYTR
jgi:hypothetical protein